MFCAAATPGSDAVVVDCPPPPDCQDESASCARCGPKKPLESGCRRPGADWPSMNESMTINATTAEMTTVRREILNEITTGWSAFPSGLRATNRRAWARARAAIAFALLPKSEMIAAIAGTWAIGLTSRGVGVSGDGSCCLPAGVAGPGRSQEDRVAALAGDLLPIAAVGYGACFVAARTTYLHVPSNLKVIGLGIISDTPTTSAKPTEQRRPAKRPGKRTVTHEALESA